MFTKYKIGDRVLPKRDLTTFLSQLKEGDLCMIVKLSQEISWDYDTKKSSVSTSYGIKGILPGNSQEVGGLEGSDLKLFRGAEEYNYTLERDEDIELWKNKDSLYMRFE